MGRRAAVTAAVLALASAAGCADRPADRPATSAARPTASPPSTSAAPAPTGTASAAPTGSPTARPSSPRHAGPAYLTIPALKIRRLRVVPYAGEADDRPGTKIQDRGLLATPRGRRGGAGPGEIGNFIVTGHRVTGAAPFRHLPSLRHGARVLVESGGVVHEYAVTATMKISFRSARDRARQSAPVPGVLGRRPTRAMMTLSTCATPEDRAAGNHWSDALGNPEHRINKIAVLVGTRPA